MPRDVDEDDTQEITNEAQVESRLEAWRPSAETTRALDDNSAADDARSKGDGEALEDDLTTDVPSDGVKAPQDGEAMDNARLDQAAERIQAIPELQPENWAKLDDYGKKAALNAAGRELQAAFHHPAPPLFIEDFQDENSLGSYGDGYLYDAARDEVVGADYGITMNAEGRVDREKLLGNDPAVALETYAHEFRHSYQHEQVNVNSKPHFRNMVDDPDRALDWENNFKEYKDPDADFDAYWNQPVEKDARLFARNLRRRVYR